MTNLTWSSEHDLPSIDEDQRRAAEAFGEYGKVAVEASPGTGKTFLGVLLAIRAFHLHWCSKGRRALFLTFSRNARVRIEREIEKFREKGWMARRELQAIKISNYHAFYLEVLRKKAGFWGCKQRLRPASIRAHEQSLENLLSDVGLDPQKEHMNQAGLVLALKRFGIDDLMAADSTLVLDDELFERVYAEAASKLRSGRPHYDDFAPLFLNLLEHCPALVEWLRLAYPVLILDEFQDTDAIQWEIVRRIRPQHIVLLFDRYQMIYEWRGARVNRIDAVVEDLEIPDEARRELTHIYRVGPEGDLAAFIHDLRTDELKGKTITPKKNRDWLVMYPQSWGTRIPDDRIRCLQTFRYAKFIDFEESTAILTRANYLADFLYDNLRLKKKGRHYRCRWIGSGNNPDEIVRDHLWRLRNTDSALGLRGWLGRLLDMVLPKPFLRGLKLEFAKEFACEDRDLLKRRRKSNLCAVREALKPWWGSVDLNNHNALARFFREIPSLGNLLLEGNGFLDPDILYYARELGKAIESFDTNREGQDWDSFCDYLEDRLIRSVYLRLRESPRGLFILTVHQSKGREFDHIIIPWLSRTGEPCRNRAGQTFPIRYKYDRFEDRRLLYVALTRARSRVTIVYPAEDPSPFIRRWKLGSP